MKHLLLLAILSITIASCTNDKASVKLKAENSVKTYIQDFAFKNNGTVSIYNYELLELNKVTGHYINNLKLNRLINQIKAINNIIETINNNLEATTDSLNQTNVVNGMSEALTAKVKLEQYKTTQDSLFTVAKELQAIIKGTAPDSLYQAKVYLKATFNYPKGSNNVMDTLLYCLDKNLKVKPID